VIELPKGYSASGVACGLKPSGKPDLGLLVSDRAAVAAGVFTTNRFPAAPVTVTKRHLRRGSARAVVVNAGNANACTGAQGVADAEQMAKLAAVATGIGAREKILVNSTGVIGVPMDMGAVERGIAAAAKELAPGGAQDFAEAIMTTDTKMKTASAEVSGARLTGFAKGAGMMAPELATMLVFLVTDAAVGRNLATAALQRAVRPSFDALNLDGCMSTNDTVLLLANGAAGGAQIEEGAPGAAEFEAAVHEVCASLSRQIADDGEGMTKLATVTVRGAANDREARKAANSIAGSVLLRCALNGADPYWGRVLAALGTAGIPLDPTKVDVWMGGEKLSEGGTFGPGDVEKARTALKEREIAIVVDMHRGDAETSVLTNDLSVEYVRFNTEYTT
jgi:glutamate N-acetyltransferase/amino-acid N-acetyltransferase